jgi:chromosome segregation ATPase
MSETQANGDNTELSAVDFALGGEPETETHSPEAETAELETGTPASAAPEAPEAEAEIFDPTADDDSPFADDSAEPAADDEKPAEQPEAEPEAENKKPSSDPDGETLALQEEISKLNKRLHDTQQAMHKANEERAKLKKELEGLKSPAAPANEDEDDWFDAETSDDPRIKEIEDKIEKLDAEENSLTEEQSDIEQKAAIAIWDIAAAEVRKEHPDFDDLVYEKFAPLLDKDSGNPQIAALWAQQKDKSPANAYRFARSIEDYLLMTSDPEGYRTKIRKELEEENKKEAPAKTSPPKQVTGKDALDMVNSAEFPEEKRKFSESAVDDIFG